MKEPALMIIDWLDHTGDSSWQDIRDVKTSKPGLMRSIGWIVHKDDKKTILMSAYELDKKGEIDPTNIGSTHLILNSCIVKKRRVRNVPD